MPLPRPHPLKEGLPHSLSIKVIVLSAQGGRGGEVAETLGLGLRTVLIRNSRLEIHNSKFKTRYSRLDIHDSRLETRDSMITNTQNCSSHVQLHIASGRTSQVIMNSKNFLKLFFQKWIVYNDFCYTFLGLKRWGLPDQKELKNYFDY